MRDSLARLTPRGQLLVVTLVFFLVRLALTIPRTGPVVVADELGYLANGRVLAGGVDGQLSTAPFYHGGYSLLFAPIVAVVQDPETSYRLVLVLNTLLAASLAPLVYLLLTRCLLVRPRAAVWPSLAAAAYPSVTIFTQVAMSESLLLPLVVLWLLCAGCMLHAASAGKQLALAAATGACAAWLWAVHGRMAVIVALTVALFALLLMRRTAMRPALLGLTVLAVGLVGAHFLDHFLVARNWEGHAKSEVSGPLSTLDGVGGLGAFLRNLVGQSWYLAVATLGVLVAAVVPFDRRWVRLRFTPARAVLSLALLTAFGLLVESALSFRTIDRPDILIYGRYTDVVVPPLLAVALVRLDAGRRIRLVLVAAALIVSTAATVLLRTRVDPPGLANRWNVASLPAPTFQLGWKVLVLAGIVAVVSLAAVVVARRRVAFAAAPLVLLLFVPTTAVIERNPVLRAQSVFYPSGWTSPEHAAGDARTIAFDTDGAGNVYVYQWFAPKSRLVLFSGKTQRPGSRLVFSSPRWASAHPGLDLKPLWADPSRDAELFRVDRGG